MFTAAIGFISPYLNMLKIGAWLALAILIGWLYMQKGYYEGKYLTAQGKLSEQDAKLAGWEQSNLRLTEYVHDQNKYIDTLRQAKIKAENNALEAIKKAKPRVQARQAIINEPPAPANNSMTCDDAVAKAIGDLDGSNL